MASASSIHHSLPLSPPRPPLSPLISSRSFLFILHQRRPLYSLCNTLKLESHSSSHAIPPSNEDYPEPRPPPTSIEQNPTKKKKKRKLRPNFYTQTLDRWSIKISSQRSKFPWQEDPESEEEEEGTAPISTTGISADLSWANGVKPRKTQLGDDPRTWNLVESSELVDVISKNRRHTQLNVGDGRTGSKESERRASVSVDESPAFGKPGDHRFVVAPWVHGAERGAHGGSKVEILAPLETGGFDREDRSGGDLIEEKPKISSNQRRFNESNDEMRPNSTRKVMAPPLARTLKDSTGNGVMESMLDSSDPEDETRIQLKNLESKAESGKRRTSVTTNKLQSSLDQDNPEEEAPGFSFGEFDEEHDPASDGDVAKLTGSVLLPWEKESENGDGERPYRRSNTELAENTIPEPELRRLRNVSLRMKERLKVGAAGVTEALVERIHEKWRDDEVVKLKFEGPPSLNMKKTHNVLEGKTGGLVIWRSGSLLVLYRGMTYKLPCVQLYSQLETSDSTFKNSPPSNDSTVKILGYKTKDLVRDSSIPSEGSVDTSDIDNLLDQLGPRFKDWSGRNPLPVDADSLPGVVAGYRTPFRLLPYKTRSSLTDVEMTSLRRLARTMPPHFALGRNRQHQGLANAMVKLWETNAIAKIAIKRGVLDTSNVRMAEEIKKLTGGVLISRNKEYIVFYRGNDFVTPSIREVLVEKENLATMKQDEEEVARLRALALISSNVETSEVPLVAGTLAETMEANTRWANQPSNKDREKMKRSLDFTKHVSLVRFLEKKLGFAQAKVRKAERALAKVQEFLQPAETPTDLETVTDEERFLFREIGLKMRAYLLLGIREVFGGTIENMHLNWKHRELVKILVKGRNFAQVKQIAISLEAESGGVLISLDKTTKGYAIITYRGKNYQRPQALRPKNLLTRRQALARSIELQRREALNHHISNLRERIRMLKSQLNHMEADRKSGNKGLHLQIDDALLSDDDVEDEGEEAYLETYISNSD